MRTPATTAWQALAGNPLRFLGSSWPWRSFGYLISTTLLCVPVLVALVAGTAVGLALTPLVVGVMLLIRLPLLGVPELAQGGRLAAPERHPLPPRRSDHCGVR